MNNRKNKFLVALLEESSITKAAEKAGISRPTAYKFLKDPDFQEELSERKSETIDGCIRYLQGKLALCNETLISIIEDPTTAPQVKINAINSVFATVKAMTETAELLEMSEKVERLSAFVEDQEGGGC
ncbi:MAG: hypothetical protein IJN44_01105 [Clostridia bacterium]|nr:hypothetical protein [Clostridia bacterium]